MADLGPKILPNKKERWGEIGAFRKKSMFEKSICFQFLGFLEKKIIFWGGSTILNYVKILYVSAPCVRYEDQKTSTNPNAKTTSSLVKTKYLLPVLLI